MSSGFGSQSHFRAHNSSSSANVNKIDEDNRVAFRTSPFITGISGRIECVSYYSSRVVVGTNDGKLIMYDTRKGTNADASGTAKY